ncbi:hypothetical protein ACIG0D_01735 [Streptomyces sp. NPDC052773]|uniref:hypothetical protein n=1 Tax=Streptomyces sp. NPDC052773 TaxID=3365693 RepID=UPI0037D24BCA
MERTDPPDPQPSPQPPQPSRVLTEPATVAACASDYAAGADVRRAMDRQDARHR